MDDNDIMLQYLESIERKIDNLSDTVSDNFDKHDIRISANERWVAHAEGKVSIIATLGVFIGGAITWLANKLFG